LFREPAQAGFFVSGASAGWLFCFGSQRKSAFGFGSQLALAFQTRCQAPASLFVARAPWALVDLRGQCMLNGMPENRASAPYFFGRFSQ
jgi:hypothetical protein